MKRAASLIGLFFLGIAVDISSGGRQKSTENRKKKKPPAPFKQLEKHSEFRSGSFEQFQGAYLASQCNQAQAIEHLKKIIDVRRYKGQVGSDFNCAKEIRRAAFCLQCIRVNSLRHGQGEEAYPFQKLFKFDGKSISAFGGKSRFSSSPTD